MPRGVSLGPESTFARPGIHIRSARNPHSLGPESLPGSLGPESTFARPGIHIRSARNPFRACPAKRWSRSRTALPGGVHSAIGENEDGNPRRGRPRNGFRGQQTGFRGQQNRFRCQQNGFRCQRGDSTPTSARPRGWLRQAQPEQPRGSSRVRVLEQGESVDRCG